MIRLMFALFAFMWSAVLDGGAGGTGGDGSGDGDGGGGGPEKVELTTDELTQRTTKAAEDKVKELAGVLGVDLNNPADVKALIEAGRKSQQGSSGGGSGGSDDGDASGVDAVLDALGTLDERLKNIETAEETRQRHAAEQTRDEKLDTALTEAGARKDRLEAVRVVAIANGAKLNDKGELVGAKAAIEATKKALPEAFRGDGDDGKAADASGRERTDRKPKTLQEALTAHYSK